LGLDSGDELLAINGRAVVELPRSAIEEVWREAQREGRYLHLELAPPSELAC